MSADVIGIPMTHVIPAGALGPEPVTLDVRAYLVPHESGFVLVDTGMDATGEELDAALARAGAAWSDVSHVVFTHGHPDHTGALDHVRAAAPGARVMADPAEGIPRTEPMSDDDTIGTLRVFATPGHTAGHVSLVDETSGVLLVGDCLGVVDGELGRGPAQFTADPDEAEHSLHRLRDLRGARMLFAHGPELSRPWEALDALLGG
jgi:glyoxylase-like metal-dependent hydrolase (beta-lactamase superfamily II)